jgi:hypothetical protein
VKPVRAHNPRAFKRERWWIFGENQPGMRRAVSGLRRYIVSTETAKHRVFDFVDGQMLAEGTVTVIASEDAWLLAVLSSRIHLIWALAAGGTLEDRPRYNKTRCFDPFPFPPCTLDLQARIRELGEALDKFRAARQAEHPELTITGLYNVLEKLKAGLPLDPREQEVHSKALVSILLEQHQRIDDEVASAYGWPADLTETQILERLVALNRERAEEEKRGLVGWLRPNYQAPNAQLPQPVQEEMLVSMPMGLVLGKANPWPSPNNS